MSWVKAIGLALITFGAIQDAGRRTGAVGALPVPRPIGRGRTAAKGKLVRADTIESRVRRIRKMTIQGGRDVRVRELAIRVLKHYGVPKQRWRAEVDALFRYVQAYVRYTMDPIEHDTYVQAARTLFDWKAGDCDDMTIALGALLMSVGYRVILVLIQTKGKPSWSHIYLIAVLPNGLEVALDSTTDHPPGWEAPDAMVVKRMRVAV